MFTNYEHRLCRALKDTNDLLLVAMDDARKSNLDLLKQLAKRHADNIELLETIERS